ncbi:MAG TPA: NAD(P)H-dependent oxidoreductase subunit E, partial [Candidatus Omnitrophota bacterium]|nr:NAD(P)H-dependent oxidoreductase subunit E [Candidatus Omnitrophota bacterium]
MNDIIKNIDDLNRLKEKAIQEKSKVSREILLCAGAGCIASGSLDIKKALEEQCAAQGIEVPIIETGCLGPCAGGPVIIVNPENIFYENLKIDDVKEIVESHLKKNHPVERLMHKNEKGKIVKNVRDNDFFQNQVKIVLRNCGKINPLDIQDYIRVDGYQGLAE